MDSTSISNNTTLFKCVYTEISWYERVKLHFGPEAVDKRPSPMPWFRYYLQLLSLRLDFTRGMAFAAHLRKTVVHLLDDSLTALQELVLSGDVETAQFQIDREFLRSTSSFKRDVESATFISSASLSSMIDTSKDVYRFNLEEQNSLLQFAVLSGSTAMVHMLIGYFNESYDDHANIRIDLDNLVENKLILEEVVSATTEAAEATNVTEKTKQETTAEGSSKDKLTKTISDDLIRFVNCGDLITGFTAFHYAMFIESVEMIELLVELHADVEKKDNYFSTAFDYAEWMGLLPRQRPKMPSFLKVWNPSESGAIEEWPIKKFELLFHTVFTSGIICDHIYIEELMFSGLVIDKLDLEFRKKYLPLAYTSSGDENLILAKVNDNIGFGVFAAKNFEIGEYIVRYAGKLMLAEEIKDKSYTMTTGIETIGLDAFKYRNLAAMINHSSEPNAECQCVFDKGVEVAIIVAVTFISKGGQILIDYSKNYWTKKVLRQSPLENIPKNIKIVFP